MLTKKGKWIELSSSLIHEYSFVKLYLNFFQAWQTKYEKETM